VTAYGNLKGTAGDRDEMSIGASYNFGVAKVVGNIQQIKYKPDAGSSAKFNNYLLGVSAPVGGVGEVKAQYAYYDQEGPAKAHQLSWAMCTTCPSALLCTALWLT
jgi:predicted porin